MTGRRGGLKKHKHPSLEADSKDKFEDLLVFGYACKLFRDDDKALQIDQGAMLIPWMGDDSIKIDRYDARGTLSDLKIHEAPQGGFDPYEGLTPEERRMEKLIDEERYFALYKNEEEEATIKEEEEKRLQQDLHQVTSQEVTYNQVPFSYSDQTTEQSNGEKATAQKSAQGDLGDAIYVPPPELDVPPGTVVPPTQKLARIVLKTAAFISTQGAQMEIVVKAKQANNPMFQFLHFDCVLHPFYRHILAAIRNGAYTVPPDDEEAAPTGTSTANANGQSNGSEDGDDDADSDDENYLHPSLQPKITEPSSIDPGPDDQPLIDKTASYLARKGRHLEPLILGKGDLRFNFLNPEHAHHAYYLRKLNLYVDMWASKSQATDEQDKENSQGSSGHEVEDQHLKNERRKKAALFLNKLRQSKSSGAGTIAEVKTDDDSTKESEAAVSRSSSSPDQAKQNQSNHSDDVEIIGSVARDSSPRSRSISRSPVRHRKHRSRSCSPVRLGRRVRSRTPSPSPSPRRRSRSRNRNRSPSRSRSRSDDRRRRHHKKRRDRSRDRSVSRRHHHRREKKHRRDTSRDRPSRKKKSSHRKRSRSVSRSRSTSRNRSRSATRSSVSASPAPSPVKSRPAAGDTISATRRTSPPAVGGSARKLAATGATLASSSETSSPLPPQLMTLQPALAKMTEGLRAKVIAMIDGDAAKK